MRYYVKVNGNVLEETYPAEEIQGYAPAWYEYQAEVEVASDWNGPFISLAEFLGEPAPANMAPPPPFALPTPGPMTMAPPPPPPAEGFAALQNFQSSAQTAAEMAPPLDPGSQIPFTRNGMARLGVGLALLGLMLVVFTRIFGPLLCVAGIVVSIVGLKHVRDEPAIYGGKGLATNGIITGSLGLVVTLIMLAFPPSSVNLPSLSGSGGDSGYQKSDDSAILLLREINSAQYAYQNGPGKGNFTDTLSDLKKFGLSDKAVSLDTTPVEGYKIVTFERTELSPNASPSFRVILGPVTDSGEPRKGAYSYFLNETGIVRRSNKMDEVANADSFPITTKMTP